MKRWKKVRGGVASAAGAALIAANPQGVAAQEVQQLERVEVTGSSVRRIAQEGAHPVQVITSEDIKRSGATSVVDLFRQLPVMQGALGHTSSLAGQTYGYANVSIHNLDDIRTLVLLNGHRVTSYGGQTLTGFAAAFDINALPISAIERIEILTDGASPIYGSDAMAGVVNVITKRNVTEGDVTVGFASPRGGAREKSLSVTKGFGSLRDDGYNVFVAVSRNDRTELNASQRPFARSSRIEFEAGGQRYRMDQGSLYSNPANTWGATISNPYLLANGRCPDNHFRITNADGDYCSYDYASQIQIYPEQRRASFLGSVNLQPSADHTLFLDLMATRSRQITRTAPSTSYGFVEPGTPLHDTYLAPYGISDSVFAMYRTADLGRRVNDDTSDFIDMAVGSKGRVGEWDYRAEFAHSQSRVRSHIAGYVGGGAIVDRIGSGRLNPFLPQGQLDAASLAALAEANYRGYWDGGVATLDTATLRASRELWNLDGGPAVLGAGVSVNRERFRADPSAFAQGLLADPVLGTPAATPGQGDLRSDASGPTPTYQVARRSYGAFSELVLPVTQQLELSGALRFDHYQDFGDATNGKASFRWAPSSKFLLRGSLGTGYHAPSGPQVGAPPQSYGLTTGYHDCSPALAAQAARLGAQCRPPESQYDLLASGNEGLEPEKSIQATLGMRFEPSRNLSFGADLWFLKISNVLGQVQEDDAFENPDRYADSWVVARDATGTDYIAYMARNRNLGKSYATGIDFDVMGRSPSSWGELGSRLHLSYRLSERAQRQPGGPFYSAINDFGTELGYVSFRWIARWTNSLRRGDWTHSLTVNARSGYLDRSETVQPIDGAGNPTGPEETVRLEVKRYYTFDWLSDWAVNKTWRLSLGVLNLFDRDPPLSLAAGGLNKGQQAGFDDRYYDPRGRVFYATASYKF